MICDYCGDDLNQHQYTTDDNAQLCSYCANHELVWLMSVNYNMKILRGPHDLHPDSSQVILAVSPNNDYVLVSNIHGRYKIQTFIVEYEGYN